MSQPPDPPRPRRGAETLLLAAVVLIAGAVLMATEVVAFRIVGRTFGSALRETTAVIAVFLTAMSAGYAAGGVLGDRRPVTSSLAVPLLVAGIWIAAVPLLERGVADRVATSALPLATHALLVTLIVFAAPAGLLAAVTPVVIRLATRGLDRAGRVAGSVSALSAVGSIAGTLITGFYLIGHYPLTSIFRGLGAVLVALAALLALTRIGPEPWSRATRRTVPALLAALTLPLAAGARVLHEEDSAYHHIKVVDRGAFRHLYFDDTRQSRMLIDDPTSGGYEYTSLFHLAWIFQPDIQRVLFVGLGGGTGPREFLADYPDVSVEAYEVDPAVIAVARRYFALPPDGERLAVTEVDGRVGLRRRDGPVDVIVVDAYTSGKYGSMIPFHLTTVEFFELARDDLSERGLLLYNVVQKLDGRNDDFLRALVKTLGAVFAEVYLFETSASNNTVVVALRTPASWHVESLSRRAQELVDAGVVTRPDYVDDALSLQDGEIEQSDVPLLTDDYAPVDRLLAR